MVAFVAAPSASAQDTPIGPADEEPTEAELAYYDSQLTCPAVGGLEAGEGSSFGTVGNVSFSCNYFQTGSSNIFMSLRWEKVGNPEPFNCDTDSYDDFDPTGASVSARAGSDSHAIVVDYSYDRATYDSFRSELRDAADTLIAAAIPYATPCPPAGIECSPSVASLTVTFETAADLRVGDGSFTYNCWWSTNEADFSDLLIDIVFALDGTITPEVTTICSAETSFESGIGFIKRDDNLAIYARYDFRSPGQRFDLLATQAEAERLIGVLSPSARSCDGVDIIRRSDYYSAIPPWLTDALEPGRALGTAPIQLAMDGSGEASGITAEPQVEGDQFESTGATPAGAPSAESSSNLFARIVGIFFLVLSLAMIALSIALMGREKRIRPRLDAIRLAAMAVVAASMVVVFSRPAPWWAIIGGVVVGGGLGWTQGQNLIVRLTDKGLYARRAPLAMTMFASGLVVSQIAGYMNRSGAIAVGIGLTVLSAATATGLMVGRRDRVAAARNPTATVVMILLLAGLVVPLLSNRPSAAQQDAEFTAQDYLKGLVLWDDIDLLGGIGSMDGKPPISFTSSEGFRLPPSPVEESVAWEWDRSDGLMAYDLDETYSFALMDDGTCCGVIYDVDGTLTLTREGTDPTVETITGTANLAALSTVQTRPDGNLVGTPFTRGELYGDDRCARNVLTQLSGTPEWTSYALDGVAAEFPPAPPQVLGQIDCDLPGFTVEAAYDLAAPPPPPGDPLRQLGSSGGCPVLQEAVAAVYEPSWEGQAETDVLGQLFLNPNLASCSGFASVGNDMRGGTRMEWDWDMASTDPATEGRQQWDAYGDFLNRVALHEIPQEDQCALNDEGVAVNRPGQESCNYRTWYQVDDGEITVWTDTDTFDGPNVLINGRFPWGQYSARCHHCEPDDPRIAETIARWHEFGSQGVGFFGNDIIDIGEVPGSRQAAAETALSEDEQALADTIDLLLPEDLDDVDREAMVIAIIGALGSSVLLGSAVAEAGRVSDLLDALRAGGLEGIYGGLEEPPGDADEIPDPDELVSAWDPNADDGYGTWVQVTRARRDELEGLDRGERRRERLARDAETLAEIRAERQRHEETMAELQGIIDGLDRRDELADQHAAILAEQAQANDPFEWLASVASDFSEGVWDDIYGILRADEENAVYLAARGTGIAIRDVLDAIADAASHPEAGTILWETFTGTAYDATVGLVIGDDESYDHLRQAADSIHAVGSAIANNPVAVAEALLAIDQLREAMNPDNELHERLQHFGIFAAEIFTEWLSGGAGAADEVIGLARLGDRLEDTSDAGRAARAAERQSLIDKYIASGAHVDDNIIIRRDMSGIDKIDNLPDGHVVPQRLIEQEFGIRPDAYRQLRQSVQRNGVGAEVRSASELTTARLAAGDVPKPAPVKLKTANEWDRYMGLADDDMARVPYRPEGWPRPHKDIVPNNYYPDLTPQQRLDRWQQDGFSNTQNRWVQRERELFDQRQSVDKLIADGVAKVDEDTHRLLWRDSDTGDFVPITGDHDLWQFQVPIPDGMTDPNQIARYVDNVKQEMLAELSLPPFNAQHGAHMDWVPVTDAERGIDAAIKAGGDPVLSVQPNQPAVLRNPALYT